MKTIITSNTRELGRMAAEEAARRIREAIGSAGRASMIVATGASQFETLASLVEQPLIDWSKVTAFHLDEYIDLPTTHPASFRKYLQERFVDRVPLDTFHYVNGEGLDGSGDVAGECTRLGELISAVRIDVALVGIGENGHLAFNDPPADFETEEPYLVVELDEACRRQQWGEGWFGSLEEVPRRAISMSVRQIMKSQHIVCSVPDERKAHAVRHAVEGPVSNLVPASILQEHSQTTLYLDSASAALLEQVK